MLGDGCQSNRQSKKSFTDSDPGSSKRACVSRKGNRYCPNNRQPCSEQLTKNRKIVPLEASRLRVLQG